MRCINLSEILRYKRQTNRLSKKKKKKKKKREFAEFAVPADHKIKLKESELRDKYLDLARELKTNKNYGT